MTMRSAGEQRHGQGHLPSDHWEPLWGVFQSVSQDGPAAFPTHKLPFQVLAQERFVARVNQKWYHFRKTKVTRGLRSWHGLRSWRSLTRASTSSLLPPHPPPVTQFRLQKHSCPEICS